MKVEHNPQSNELKLTAENVADVFILGQLAGKVRQTYGRDACYLREPEHSNVASGYSLVTRLCRVLELATK